MKYETDADRDAKAIQAWAEKEEKKAQRKERKNRRN